MTKRLLSVLFLGMILSACTVMEDPLDEQVMQRLLGSWQQVDGRTTLTFYDDQTVKLVMPDEQPPLRLLTSVENNKDHGIGFSVGDRWGGPVYILQTKDGPGLQLKFPPDDPNVDNGRVIDFVRGG